ncbi:MAG: hypothetical protein EBS38_02840 [Actinobacteria bacterium]|nr:hypothetical protein [Actinomycetota bacterium]
MANPAIDHIFAADPSAHVFEDRLYVYVSYDQPDTNTHDSMVSYHCLSTEDLVNWVDHGEILHLDAVDWAISHMWAIDANYWQGKYYLTFCAIDRDTSFFQTGIAVSERPEGPFRNLGKVQNVEWGQDPGFFVDNETPYLVWGGRGEILIAELAEDLMSVKPETIKNLSADLDGYEGPFLHKYQDRFYLTFPALDNEKWPQRMCYAVADHPLGPYKNMGVYIDVYEGNSGTIHGSCVEFKGQWYALYHSAWVSGRPTSRSLMIDKLEYRDDGSIVPIVPSKSGAVAGKTSIEIHLDAASGFLWETKTRVDSSDFSGHGYVCGFVAQERGFSVKADFGVVGTWKVYLRYRSSADTFHGRMLFGNHLFYDGNQNQSYDQYIKRGTVFPGTAGQWEEVLIGEITVAPGQYQIRFSASLNLEQSDFAVDRVRLVPAK